MEKCVPNVVFGKNIPILLEVKIIKMGMGILVRVVNIFTI